MASDFVAVEERYCTGCTQCVRACFTKAIRIKNGKAVQTPELCIGCGECIRSCPEGAIISTFTSHHSCNIEKLNVAIVSPILYAQFPGFMPSDVLLGLKLMGFDHAIDLAYYLEIFQYATEEYITRSRKLKNPPRPVISPVCPVATRLIALKYPDLLRHILPLKSPAALVGEEIRKKLSKKHNVKKEDIILYHITPCHAKVVPDSSGLMDDLSYMDQSVGINEIYPKMVRKMEEIQNYELSLFPYEHFSFVPSARGPLWGVSGGEIGGMRLDNVIAVSGLKETITYIEKIEMGLFDKLDYIEFRTCREGCIGGPLTAVDRYVAKSIVQKFVKMFGLGRRLPRSKIKQLYDKDWFFSRIKHRELAGIYKSPKRKLTITQMEKIEKLVTRIHGNDCAACGAPACRTFAEDVVRGDADLKDCFKVRNE